MSFPEEKSKGFALITAVALLAFVALLVVGLAGMLRVEVGSEVSSREIKEARGNAEMALGIALGKLLNLAGEDQRVTANAAILDRNPSTEMPDGVKHPYWTGVWKSWAQKLDDSGPRDNIYYENSDSPSLPPWDYKSEHNKRFLGWLVSLNDDLTRGRSGESLLNLPLTISDSDPNFIELVGSGSVGKNADQRLYVKAEKIPLYQSDSRRNPIVRGHYAWWVGDEGVKASMAPIWNGKTDTVNSTEHALVQEHMAAAPRVGIGAISAIKNLQDRSNDELKKLFTRSSLELFSGNIESAKQLFHDVTPVSYGVLSNVRNGGLKKDLNLFLERKPPDVDHALMTPWYIVPTKNDQSSDFQITGEDFFEGIEPTGIIKASTYDFQWDETGSGGDKADPAKYNKLAFAPWGFIHHYYQLYKDMRMERGLPMFRIEDLKGKDSERNRVMVPQGATRDYMPTLSKAQRIYSYYTMQDGTGFKIWVCMDVVITLWNPYNVAFDGRGQYFYFKNYDIPVKMTFFADSKQVGTVQYRFRDFMQSPPIMEIGYLRPGETKVYSPLKVYSTASELQFRTGWVRGNGIHLPTDVTVPNANSVVGCTIEADVAAGGWDSMALHFPCWVLGHVISGFGGKRDWDRRGLYMRPLFLLEQANAMDRLRLIYPTIRKPSYTAWELSGESNAIPGFVQNVALKTAKGFKRTPPGRHLEFTDVTFGFGNCQFDNEKSLQNYQYEIEMRNINSWEDSPLVEVSSPEGDGNALGKGNNGYIGGGQDAANGQPFFVYSELPTQPLISLPQLRHAQMIRAEYDFDMVQHVKGGGINGVGNKADVPSSENTKNFPFATFLVGNSQAHPYIKSTALETTIKSKRVKKDYKYYANHVLWDNYYFSAMAPQDSVFFDSKRSLNQVVSDFFDGKKPLANPRFIPYVTESLNVSRINPDNADAYREIAQWQLVNGSFNINSTSVNAWKAMLASLHGQTVPVIDVKESNPSISLREVDGYPVSRITTPGGDTPDEAGDRDLYWRGYRSLTETQITELAERIVEEVKKRGPFLSLGEFVNRQVTNDKELAVCGAVQAAINAATSINNTISRAGRTANWKDVEFSEAAQGRTTAGTTGWVNQADILQPIAPVISARSDTFLIRCYGDSVDMDGNVTARAWAEAVVQRVPELFDTGVSLPEEAPRVSSRLNSYKRAFKIISFRWLSPDEV